jgi:F0F1-type ATP synthase membrane subunit b/b'
MVTPEERITRLEAVQEANTQQMTLVLSRLEQVLYVIEAARQESREMNEVARKEAREMNDATRQEAREENRALRQEMLQLVEAARRDARNLFIAAISIGAVVATGLGGGIITLMLRILERLPG